MLVDGIIYCFGIFLKDLSIHYKESEAKLAWVGSLLAGVTMLVGPGVSVVTNKYGCRISCMSGAIIASASFALSTLCPSVELLMFVYGVCGGIGFGLMYVPAVVCVGYYFESKRSLATGIAVCGSGVGTIVFAPFGRYLLVTFGWKGANLVLAAVCLSGVIFGFLMKPIEYKKPEKTVTMVYQNGTPAIMGDLKKSYTSLTDLSASRHSLASNKSKKSQVLPPLARQDVLYTGSIRNLKEYQSQKSLHDFRQSMLNIPTDKSKYSVSSSRLCRIFGDLLDLSLIKNPVFIVIILLNFMGFIALYIPFVFIGEATEKDDISKDQSTLLISLMGITNTVGRIVCGFIADFPKVNTLLVNNVCMIVMSIALGGIAFCHHYISYVAVTFIYGSAMAGYISLTSILLVEFLGLEKLTSAFGLLILFRGSGALIGPPVHGLIMKSFSYSHGFLVASGFLTISSLLSCSIPFIRKIKRNNTKDRSLEPVNLNVEEAA
ncbi:monocarboxylate transporter 14-like isoform X2 [Diorhabda sublineata]|nr:monocarboxylate transporter 14-like isoform X2 [Diorhabda sublineata]